MPDTKNNKTNNLQGFFMNMQLYLSGDNELGRRYTRKDIARTLGDESRAGTIKNILNGAGNYRTTNRDLMTAICYSVDMNPGKIDQVLASYGMDELTASSDPRDQHIKTCIEIVQKKYPEADTASFHYLQKMISDEYPALAIDRTAKQTKKRQELKLTRPDTFEVLENPRTEVFSLPEINVIESWYNLWGIRVSAWMEVKEKITGKRFRLRLELPPEKILSKNSVNLHIDYLDEVDKESFFYKKSGREQIKQDTVKFKVSALPDKDLYPFFDELYSGVVKKKLEVRKLYDDTRNFDIRVTAEFRNELLLFAETFNYENPLKCEYYQMKKDSDGYRMTVTNSSVFMQHYLGEEYKTYYGAAKEEIADFFESIDEIEEQKNRLNRIDELNYKQAFVKLQNALDETIRDIKEDRLSISYDINTAYSGYHIAKYYKIVDKFEWIYEDANIPLPTAINENCVLTVDGDDFVISLASLKKAIGLGLKNIENVYQVIKKYGSIENAIQ